MALNIWLLLVVALAVELQLVNSIPEAVAVQVDLKPQLVLYLSKEQLIQ
jgi:hypothetical protein